MSALLPKADILPGYGAGGGKFRDCRQCGMVAERRGTIAVKPEKFAVRDFKFPIPPVGNFTADPLWVLASSVRGLPYFNEIPCIFPEITEFEFAETRSPRPPSTASLRH